MGGEGFDLDRATQSAWNVFVGQLAEVLSMMEPGATFTITKQTGDLQAAPQVRFACEEPDQIWVEASSNASLNELRQLSGDDLQRMEEFGWAPPSAAEGTQDFTARFSTEDTAALAVLVVASLRSIYGVEHPVFLAIDELGDVFQNAPGPFIPISEYEVEDLTAILPNDQRHLDEMVEAQLVAAFGHSSFRDAAGDAAIRVGSTMVFVRSTPDCREVVLFSALVHDVSGRSRAAEVLNDLNVESRYGRFALYRDRVLVQMSVPAHPFVPAHLHQALKTIAQIADGIDEELARRLRGRTTFDDKVD